MCVVCFLLVDFVVSLICSMCVAQIPDGHTEVTDIIRGTVRFQNAAIDDQVLLCVCVCVVMCLSLCVVDICCCDTALLRSFHFLLHLFVVVVCVFFCCYIFVAVVCVSFAVTFVCCCVYGSHPTETTGDGWLECKFMRDHLYLE